MRAIIISPEGAAASILAEKVRRLALEMSFTLEICVADELEALEKVNEFDMILLAPALRFLRGKMHEFGAKNDAVVKVISSNAFGSLDVDAIFRIILSASLGKKARNDDSSRYMFQ